MSISTLEELNGATPEQRQRMGQLIQLHECTCVHSPSQLEWTHIESIVAEYDASAQLVIQSPVHGVTPPEVQQRLVLPCAPNAVDWWPPLVIAESFSRALVWLIANPARAEWPDWIEQFEEASQTAEADRIARADVEKFFADLAEARALVRTIANAHAEEIAASAAQESNPPEVQT
jgi:hypothetical protein